MNINEIRLRKQIIVPIALMVIMILGLVSILVYYLLQEHIEKSGRERLVQVQQLLPLFLVEESRVIEATLCSLNGNHGIQQAWLSRDRQTLLKLATPHFETMGSHFGISHFHFIAPDQSCFLRVHKPDRHQSSLYVRLYG